MALTELDIEGYRSLRDFQLRLKNLNVVTGANASGKSNLYRSLWFIAQICEGSFAQSICREGGLLSVMWAGPRRDAKKPMRMSLGFRTADLTYQMACGFPQPSSSRFCYDPEIKEECVWIGAKRKPTSTLLERTVGTAWIRDVDGQRIDYPLTLDPNESVLTQLREPHRFPELLALREEVRGWRFYHTFRTDEDAPLRSPRASVRTNVLSHDGSDLAATLQSIKECGDGHALHATVAAAFPGRRLRILANDDDPRNKSPRFTELSVGFETEGCARPLLARELSDGTLKFLCLAASLLSPRPPTLIALNEPEASLHPDLFAPLAQLIVNASRFSQIWVSTHSPALTQQIHSLSGVRPVELELSNGETVIQSQER